MQNIIISGHVGGNPETRQAGESTVTTFSVAVNNPRNRQAPPTWYRVECWNGLGSTVSQYVGKGDYVVVTADRQKVSPYIDNNGKPAASIDLHATGVDFSANRRNTDEEPAF